MAQPKKSHIEQLPISINDLEEKYLDDEVLTADEQQALHNFNQYKLEYLKSAHSEKEFQERLLQVQVEANITPFQNFLELDSIAS